MSLFCQYAPFDLDGGTWGERRAGIGANIVETVAEYAPNLPEAIEHIEVLGPPNIEARVGITGGNIFHGEILPERKFGNRPQLLWLPHPGRGPLPLRRRRVVGRSSARPDATAHKRSSRTGRSGWRSFK